MNVKIHKLRSFRTQLTLTISLLIFVTITLISIIANILINKEFEDYARRQQKNQGNNIVTNLLSQYDASTNKWSVEYVHGVGMSALYDGYIIKLSDLEGNVVWDAKNHDMETCNQVMMEITTLMEKRRPELAGNFISQNYILHQNGQEIGSVTIEYYGPYFLSESEFNFLDSLNLILLMIGIFALLCSIVAGGILAKRISRSIIKTAGIAKQISKGNYKIRFNGKIKTRELDELVSAINHMSESLETQETLRKRLTTDVAHELRTPLTAVASHLEAMIDGLWDITPQRLQSCNEEISRISGLVTDLEQLAKVENENLCLNKDDVDLLELARIVAGNFEMESMKKNITITVEGPNAIVFADKDRLNQVLTNLVSNAIKYTFESGKISVVIQDTENEGIISVQDNGIGIPEKDLPYIFERFYRTDLSRNRATGGAGIGLTIVKSIVTAHGGTVKAESDQGKGSRFTVQIPKRSVCRGT